MHIQEAWWRRVCKSGKARREYNTLVFKISSWIPQPSITKHCLIPYNDSQIVVLARIVFITCSSLIISSFLGALFGLRDCFKILRKISGRYLLKFRVAAAYAAGTALAFSLVWGQHDFRPSLCTLHERYDYGRVLYPCRKTYHPA